MSCPTNNPKRPATVPTHILEVANLTFDTASPYTRPRSHIGGSGAHRGRDRLLCASVRRETALVCATTVRYKQHTIGRSLARRQRLRPRWVPNSQHKAHKGGAKRSLTNDTTRARKHTHIIARRPRRRLCWSHQRTPPQDSVPQRPCGPAEGWDPLDSCYR